jgi:hypothetical protein
MGERDRCDSSPRISTPGSLKHARTGHLAGSTTRHSDHPIRDDETEACSPERRSTPPLGGWLTWLVSQWEEMEKIIRNRGPGPWTIAPDGEQARITIMAQATAQSLTGLASSPSQRMVDQVAQALAG